MKFLRTSTFLLLLGLLVLLAFVLVVFKEQPRHIVKTTTSDHTPNIEWLPPNEATLPSDSMGRLVRYGKELFVSTAVYLGPEGTVAKLSNGMNCQNCHMDAGRQLFANCLSAVAANYPRYRERSGIVESIAFRINDCMMRSLNGHPIDSTSKEMQAMVAYLKWLGKDVPSAVRPRGAGYEQLPFLSRAADPDKGKAVYISTCKSCHGSKGEGLLSADATHFVYPPLWGKASYNNGAGMYRLSQFASFVKNNMPFGTTYAAPKLTNEQAWDVAAFVNSQPRPHKPFASDWPLVSKKPLDHPFGPYADSFSERQHKYGPFISMKKNVALSANAQKKVQRK